MHGSTTQEIEDLVQDSLYVFLKECVYAVKSVILTNLVTKNSITLFDCLGTFAQKVCSV